MAASTGSTPYGGIAYKCMEGHLYSAHRPVGCVQAWNARVSGAQGHDRAHRTTNEAFTEGSAGGLIVRDIKLKGWRLQEIGEDKYIVKVGDMVSEPLNRETLAHDYPFLASALEEQEAKDQ